MEATVPRKWRQCQISGGTPWVTGYIFSCAHMGTAAQLSIKSALTTMKAIRSLVVKVTGQGFSVAVVRRISARRYSTPTVLGTTNALISGTWSFFFICAMLFAFYLIRKPPVFQKIMQMLTWFSILTKPCSISTYSIKRGSSRGLKMGHNVKSVSYTHLTLPTKRIV